MLHHGGIKDDNIVVMMADDIAGNYQNPHPGRIFNSPGGADVYEGVPVVRVQLAGCTGMAGNSHSAPGGPDGCGSFPGLNTGRQAAHAWLLGASGTGKQLWPWHLCMNSALALLAWSQCPLGQGCAQSLNQ